MRSPADSASSQPSLSALQSQMSAALLGADASRQQLPEAWFTGAHAGAVGLRVHRHTILSALSNALRMTFVSIDKLVGEDFFDRMAVEYARAAPPRAPQLDVYGSDFPAFITDFPGTENLPYLADLARFDGQLDELGRLPAGDHGVSIQLGGVRLRLASTLRVHTWRYAVDELRTAILAEDTEALAAVTPVPGEHRYALWRSTEGVKAQPLSAVSARFLIEVLAGAEGTQALTAAVADQHTQVVAEILTAEVIAASFVHIEKDPS